MPRAMTRSQVRLIRYTGSAEPSKPRISLTTAGCSTQRRTSARFEISEPTQGPIEGGGTPREPGLKPCRGLKHESADR